MVVMITNEREKESRRQRDGGGLSGMGHEQRTQSQHLVLGPNGVPQWAGGRWEQQLGS